MNKTLVFIDEGFLSKISKFFGKGEYLKFDKIKFAKMISKKNKKGSNRVDEPRNYLTRNCNKTNNTKYLNVSIDLADNHADMAEWLLQLSNTQCSFGVEGSIPSAGVINIPYKKLSKEDFQ